VDRVEERLKKKPQQMVADGGYTTRDTPMLAQPHLASRKSSLRNASGRDGQQLRLGKLTFAETASVTREHARET